MKHRMIPEIPYSMSNTSDVVDEVPTGWIFRTEIMYANIGSLTLNRVYLTSKFL